MKEPNIFEYLEIQLYLKEIYKFKKAKLSSFSYDLWATELGFKSRGHLRDIVIGNADLTEKLIPLFTAGLKLDPETSEYFTLLSRYSTASSATTKAVYGKSLIQSWKVKLHQVEVTDISSFLSDAIIPVLFTYLSFDDTSSDITDIAKALNSDELRVQNALRCLVWQKLVDGQINLDGSIKYKVAHAFFKIPDLPGNDFLKDFHIQGLNLAIESHALPSDSRKFYSAFVALDMKQFAEVQNILKESNEKILSLFEKPSLGERKIYRINSQIFPASKLTSDAEL